MSQTYFRANRRAWTLLIVAIVCEVAGSLSLRGALDIPWLYAVVVVSYIAAFTCLALALRAGFGVGVAYGIWGAFGVALTALGSMVLFDEPISLTMGIGMVMIIAGVVCIELGGQSAGRAGESRGELREVIE